MTEQTTLDPDNADAVKGFDLAAWIDGSKRPERSTVLYGRPDLYAELDRIQRDMRLAGGDGEASMADKTAIGKLQREYERIAKEIEASALTFRVRAANEDAIKQARRDVKAEKARDIAAVEWVENSMADDVEADARDAAEYEGITDEDDVAAFVRKKVLTARQTYIASRTQVFFTQNLLARLLVSPRVSSVEQLRTLLDRVGPTQADKLYELIGQTNRDVQVPTAPFSRPSSRAKRGGASSKS